MSLGQVGQAPNTGIRTQSANPCSKMSNPWGQAATTAVVCSLEDVMSEQLAADMQQQQQQFMEAGQADGSWSTEDPDNQAGAASPTDYQLSDAELAAKLVAEDLGVNASDELLARYLQKEFDQEYDAMIANKEKKFNGKSKVSVSFENYKMKHQREETLGADDDDDDDEYDHDLPEFPAPASWDTPVPNIGAKGYTGRGKDIITKHDNVICGRRNAERLMEFPPEYDIGDGEGMDMKLSNKVYNKLKSYSIAETKRGQKVHEKKEHSTVIKAVDDRTRILLFKLVNSGVLTSIDGVVSSGKEAVICKASGGMKAEVKLPKDIILKVYKTTMNEFRTRAKYIAGDHRLSKDVFKKHNPRKMIRIWTEKECMNLHRMRKHNIPCPTPIVQKRHVLAMTCIGGENPAPKLKEVRLNTEDMQDAYEQTVQIIKALYRECRLVHADLSEYNLLWHDGKVWVIDVSQSVEAENASANEFLLRDCQNISSFFSQAGVYGVAAAEELFMDVTNYCLEGTGAVFASQVTRYQKTDYPFDVYFEQSEAVREQGLVIEDSSDSDGDDHDDNDDDCCTEDNEEQQQVKEETSKEENTDLPGVPH